VAGKRETPKAVTLGVLAFGPGFCYSAEKKKLPGRNSLTTPQKMSRLFRRRKVLLVNGLCGLPFWQTRRRSLTPMSF
jgi:hypothetical protein